MWYIESTAGHVKRRRMKETFIQIFEGVFLAASVSDRHQQQDRLAVLVAQTRGAVWSGVCASLYIARVSHRSSSVRRNCIPFARFPARICKH